MKTIYLDLFSGISGDMFIGALLDLGIDFALFERELKKLKLDGYHLHVGRGTRRSVAGTKFDVHTEGEHGHAHAVDPSDRGSSHHARVEPHHHHEHEHHGGHEHTHHDEDHGHHATHEHGRSFAAIRSLIESSELSSWVRAKSVAVFLRIAQAEGKIHGVPAEEVHFHEVGAIDSIVDIVGGCICLDLLGRPRVLASGVVEGRGTIHCAHGEFPIPVPATLAILGQRGVAVTQCDESHELVTPTGAGLLAELAESFGPMHGLVANRIGIGLGTRESLNRPNVLRAIFDLGGVTPTPAWEIDSVSVLETNIDDSTPEALGNFLEHAMENGALDVFFVPAQAKKNRPGVLLTLICQVTEADRFSEMILRETTAFGVRRSVLERRKLAREFVEVSTRFGSIKIKIGRASGEVWQASPEYEDCRRAAREAGVPMRQVFEAARAAAMSLTRTF